MDLKLAEALYQGDNCIVQMERQREDGVYAFLLNQCLDGFVAAEPLHNLQTLHQTACIGVRPVVLCIANTACTDSVMIDKILHQWNITAEAVPKAVRVLVDIALSLTVQVAEGSSSRDSTLWVALQFEFLQLALTSCWSGCRLSFIDEMFSKESSTDDCSEGGYGVGDYPGDLPGYDRNIIQLVGYRVDQF